MTTVAIVPAKAFDQAKQRLSPEVKSGNRRALIESMFSDAMVALRRAQSIDQVIVVTSDRTAARIAGGNGASVIDDTADSHSEAAELGIAQALELGATRALLVPGDCPMLDPAELDALIAQPVVAPSVIIVPDRHGEGTNALLLTPPNAMTPSFGEGSRQRHIDLATAQGATPEVYEVPTLALDIDTPQDLEELIARFAGSRGGAAHTRGMLNQLTRSEPG
jgi:2-phospho-L-lactate/phosphoenolpyruvate guanylyltransferase